MGAFLVICANVILAGPAVASRAAIVIDSDTGIVLYEKQADHRHYPASLSKMMTLYLLFEALKEGRVTMDTRFSVSARAAGQPRSKLGLHKGETITVRDAMLALIVKSANDVATVVAEGLGDAEWRFAGRMTRTARKLGMHHTSFRNASGLPNRRQITTARDLATLARALYRDFPQYYEYFSTPSFTYKNKTYRNHNRLLDTYAGVDGLKTGYIRASQFNLATSASRGGRHLIAIVLGAHSSQSRDREMVALLDRGFVAAREARAAPPPPPPEKPTAVARAPWAIQIGAYSRIESAYAVLRDSRRHISKIVARAAAVVVPVEEGDGGLFRARFVGVSASDARSACNTLKRKKFECEVVRHMPDTETLALAGE